MWAFSEGVGWACIGASEFKNETFIVNHCCKFKGFTKGFVLVGTYGAVWVISFEFLQDCLNWCDWWVLGCTCVDPNISGGSVGDKEIASFAVDASDNFSLVVFIFEARPSNESKINVEMLAWLGVWEMYFV